MKMVNVNNITKDEKIERLKQLSPYEHLHKRRDYWIGWLKVAETFETLEQFLEYVDVNGGTRQQHCEAVWAVHTGEAFSKLWKVLR
jgi:hypothetical protein